MGGRNHGLCHSAFGKIPCLQSDFHCSRAEWISSQHAGGTRSGKEQMLHFEFRLVGFVVEQQVAYELDAAWELGFGSHSCRQLCQWQRHVTLTGLSL